MKTKSILGVGTNDIPGMTQTKIYRRWVGMISRVHGEGQERCRKHNTYRESTISKEWYIFSNFKRWMESQEWEGKHLDKDILIPGNKHYSVDTCVFIDQHLNKLLNFRRNDSGEFPLGVTFRKNINKFEAQLRIDGKKTSLGYFATSKEAHTVYVYEKIKEIEKFYSKVSAEIIRGLSLHIDLLKNELHKS